MVLLQDQWEAHVHRSVTHQWYATAKKGVEFVRGRHTATARRKTAEGYKRYKATECIDCPGVGFSASDFMATVEAELLWWPVEPIATWATELLGQAVGVVDQSHKLAIMWWCKSMGLLDIQ